MNPINSITNVLTSKIIKLKGYTDEEQIEVLRYGLYVVISDIAKNLVLMVTAYFLGLFLYALFTYIAMGLLKSFMGGVHAKTFWGCLTTNIILVLGISYVSTHVISNPNPIFFFGSFLICIIAIFKYAPADIANKPIRSKILRKRLQYSSYAVCIIYLLLSLYLKNTPFSSIMMFSVIADSVLILPLAYKLTKNQSGEFYASTQS